MNLCDSVSRQTVGITLLTKVLLAFMAAGSFALQSPTGSEMVLYVVLLRVAAAAEKLPTRSLAVGTLLRSGIPCARRWPS